MGMLSFGLGWLAVGVGVCCGLTALFWWEEEAHLWWAWLGPCAVGMVCGALMIWGS